MAIFRKYQLLTNKHTPFNQVGLYFSIRHDDNVLYALASSVELLFPDKTIEESKRILESNIGKNIDINTFTISVKDLTNGVYKHLIYENGYSTQVTKEIKVASLMDFEEEIRSRKILFAFQALNGDIIGVRQDNNNQEEIENPGIIFNLSSFLKYNAASKASRSISKSLGMGDPDRDAIQKAAINYRRGINSIYNVKLQHLFD